MRPDGAVIEVNVLAVPKRGNTPAECEDAFAANAEKGRFAIADGASQSMFSGLWARLLVDAFVANPHPQLVLFHEWLLPLQEDWDAKTTGKSSSWYAQTKLQEGAFATFLGIALEKPGTRVGRPQWRAFAIGDACLFQVRKDKLARAFPLTKSAEFGNTPWLLGSRAAASENLLQKTTSASGRLRRKDCFWLMTDALGQWFLQECERQNKPWNHLEALLRDSNPDGAFGRWVEDLRNREELRNDDVTVAEIRV